MISYNSTAHAFSNQRITPYRLLNLCQYHATGNMIMASTSVYCRFGVLECYFEDRVGVFFHPGGAKSDQFRS